MKRLSFALLVALGAALMISCSKFGCLITDESEQDEYQEYIGEYLGTYYAINAWGLTADEYCDSFNQPNNWPNGSATVHVSISEGVVTVLINSSIGVKRLKSEFKESNGTIRCEGMNGSGNHNDSIEIGDGMITYYRHSITYEQSNGMVKTYGFSGEKLVAYKLN